MEIKSLLAVFAHPDDEAFGTGGALALYSTSGVHVTLVCATRGEVGEIADPDLANPETLGDVREEELRAAARTLGVNDVVLLGYRDSGMAGTPPNQDPRAFVQAPAEEVIRRLVGIIRRTRPQVVITFEPNGGYGHPDHIAISRHTTTAFHEAARAEAFPSEGPAWQANRLFYTAIPRSFFVELKHRMEEAGVDTSEFERFSREPIGWPDEQVHCTLDVSGYVEAKWWAVNCHMTQFGPNNLFRRVPEGEMKRMMAREYYALAWPTPPPGLRLTDLFEAATAVRAT